MIRDGKSSQTTQQFIDKIEEAFELMRKQEIRKMELGTRKQPYQVFVSEKVYEQIKQYLDEEDMYFCGELNCYGWAKFNVVKENQVVANYYQNNKLSDTKGTDWFGKAWQEQHPRLGHITQHKTIQEQNKENFKKFVKRKGKK